LTATPVQSDTEAPPQASQYSVTRARIPRDRALILQAWRGNLGDPALIERKFDWFYERSPTGEPVVCLLGYDGKAAEGAAEVAGVAAAGRRPFLIGNDRLDALVLVDMTVVPKHRTLFPALMLQRRVLADGLEAAPLLYGFPNRKAAPVFKHVGYRKLGSMTRYARVLRSASYLRARMPGWLAGLTGPVLDLAMRLWLDWRPGWRGGLSLRWTDMSDAEVGAPVTELGGRPLLQGLRTGELLRWRFESTDTRVFGFVAVRESSARDELGYWVVEPVGDVLQVRDCAVNLIAGGSAAAWAVLCREAHRRGFRSISFECVAPDEVSHQLRKIGLRARNERPLFGICRDDYSAALEGAYWYLTSADEDE